MPEEILYLVGLPGAGKSTTLEVFQDFGIPTFYTGDVHPESSGSEKLEYGDTNFTTDHGFITQVIEQAVRRYPDADRLVVDSLRSPTELDYINTRPEKSFLIAIVCPKNERRSRLRRRDTSMKSIRRREHRELGNTADSKFDVGQLIAVADYYIVNSETFEGLYKQVNTLVKEIDHDGN